MIDREPCNVIRISQDADGNIIRTTVSLDEIRRRQAEKQSVPRALRRPSSIRQTVRTATNSKETGLSDRVDGIRERTRERLFLVDRRIEELPEGSYEFTLAQLDKELLLAKYNDPYNPGLIREALKRFLDRLDPETRDRLEESKVKAQDGQLVPLLQNIVSEVAA